MAPASDTSHKSPQASSGDGDHDTLLTSPFSPPLVVSSSFDYESVRAKRIQENRERARQLGLINFSLPFKGSSSLPADPRRKTKSSGQRRKPKSHATASNSGDDLEAPKTTLHPPRRSLRLQKLAVETDHQENGATNKKVESYTEEDVKLLGGCEEPWIISSASNRYGKKKCNQEQGKTCHQCRQKSSGHHTNCENCKSQKGQLCGHCLYTRYGENVLEAQRNPSWICPPCRGICNCSYCRTRNGLAPTGRIYDKVVELGYKSVAHYLILTFQERPHSEDP